MEADRKIKVIIADDHGIYLEGLRTLLKREAEIELVGEASNGRELIDKTRQLEPDVILTDLIMPEMDGIQAIKEIVESGLPVKCIAISTYDTDLLIVEALEAGAKGYIVKNADKGEIIEAIKTVYEGYYYYCKTTTSKLVRKISRSKFNPYKKINRDLFSEQEKEIIVLICQEKISDEIGSILSMSPRTVERIRSKILEKANVKTTIGLVIYAIKNGIYFIESGFL
ncbi:MAG: response regulator transcription factor [Bacteroidota bacterium]